MTANPDDAPRERDTRDAAVASAVAAARAPLPLRIGEHTLHVADRRLLDARQQPVRLGQRGMALLCALAGQPGAVLRHAELIARVWPDRPVEDNTLRVTVAALRRVLDGGREPSCIASIAGRGYSLIPSVAALVPFAAFPEGRPGATAVPHAEGGTAPAPRALIGRGEARDALRARVLAHRLVTVVAPGGMGKTVLAAAVAADLAPDFAHGRLGIDLAQVGPEAIEAAVDHALGPPPAGRGLLLVLDTCEHRRGALAPLVERLLRRRPALHLLATSREPLGLPGEQHFDLGALAWPEPGSRGDPAARSAWPALQLLVECVRACDGGRLRIDAGNVAHAVALCQRLDGHPLSLELVAPRVAAFGLGQALADLDEELLQLRHPRRGVPNRHRTLVDLLDWSHALLDETERLVLCGCSLFEGRFTPDAACELLSDAGLDGTQVLGGLEGLGRKSLLRSLPGGGPAARALPEGGPAACVLPGATCAYARRKLHERGLGDSLRLALAQRLRTWLARARVDWARGDGGGWHDAHGWLGAELLATVPWCLRHPASVELALPLVGEAWMFALSQRRFAPWTALIAQVRDRLGPCTAVLEADARLMQAQERDAPA